MIRFAAIPAVALAAALWQTPLPQRPPPFRSGVDTVVVYAAVRGSGGQFASNLQQEDFEILDSGQPREIVAFSNEQQPTTISILLDRSSTMMGLMARVTAGAGAFIGKLLPADRASLSSLSWECQTLTGDSRKLQAALDRGIPFDWGSPIWRAMDRVMTSLDAEGGRRALLVFSDGQDSGPGALLPTTDAVMTPESCRLAGATADVSAAEVIAHAREEGLLVYAISPPPARPAPPAPRTMPPPPPPPPDTNLARIANESGGEIYAMRASTDLTGAFTAIADELHHQYLLGFVPAVFDDKVHTIDVRVKRPGMSVRARKSYVASRAGSSGPEADARAFASRPSWPEVTDSQVQEAISSGEAGRRLQASCTAAAEFSIPSETRASVRIVAEGPIGRIMRVAGEARRRQQTLEASAVTGVMRAPAVVVTAALNLVARFPLDRLEVRGRGRKPIVLVPTDTRLVAAERPPGSPGGVAATFTMTDFKGLPGGEVEVVVTSLAGQRRCRFGTYEVDAIR